MGINTTIRNFRNDITAYVNQSDLPIEVKLLTIKDIYAQLEDAASKTILAEQQAQQQEETQQNDSESVGDDNECD